MKKTYGEGDYIQVVDIEWEEPTVETEQGESMAEDSDAKQFGEALLKSVQDLAKQIEVMGQRFMTVEARQRGPLSRVQVPRDAEGHDAPRGSGEDVRGRREAISGVL